MPQGKHAIAIIGFPVSESPGPPTAGATRHTCATCDAEVWVSPSSFAKAREYPEAEAVVFCALCGLIVTVSSKAQGTLEKVHVLEPNPKDSQ